MNPRDVSALTYLISRLRHEWPKDLIENALTKVMQNRALGAVCVDVFDAATNLHLKAPGVLATHRRITVPETRQSSQPPPIAELKAASITLTKTDHDAAARYIAEMKARTKTPPPSPPKPVRCPTCGKPGAITAPQTPPAGTTAPTPR